MSTRIVLAALALLMGATAHAQPTPAPDPGPTPTADPTPTPTPTPTPDPNPTPTPDPNPTPTPDPTPTPTPTTDPAPDDDTSTSSPFGLSSLQIHGFISQGAFVSTANDYIGRSSDGSLELFEAGLTVSAQLTDRLRAGIQLFTRNVGEFDDPPLLDWGYLDYQWKPYLGLRAGVIKMPYGLYNEYADIDAARVPILLPQSLYPLRDRSALLSQTGFAVYGDVELGPAGALDYQAWFGTLVIPENALILGPGASFESIDTKYVTGGQVFWSPPVDGLRVGASYMRIDIDFRIQLDAATTAEVIAAGLAPPGYDGKLLITQGPASFWVASAEYTRGDWMFQAEYSRWFKHQEASIPALSPTIDNTDERFYALATRRFDRHLEAGLYYSVFHADVDDRTGDETPYPEKFYAFQRDAAATLRIDVNDNWMWKLEAHFIDGIGDLLSLSKPDPERYWGLFLAKTTVTF